MAAAARMVTGPTSSRHCEKRSDEAISARLGPLRTEIAAAPSAPRNDDGGSRGGSLENRPAVDDGQFDAALHRAAVERRVLRFGAEAFGLDTIRRRRVEDDEIGGRAGRQ